MVSKRAAVSLKGTGLTWGLYMGLALGLLATVFIVMGTTEKSFNTVGSLLLTIVGLAMSMYTYRKEAEEVSYRTAFKLGALVSLVAGVILGVVNYIVLSFVFPGFIDLVKRDVRREIAAKVEPEMLDMVMESPFITIWFKPSVLAVTAFFNTLLLGIFLTLILAAIFKRSQPAAR